MITDSAWPGVKYDPFREMMKHVFPIMHERMIHKIAYLEILNVDVSNYAI